MQNTRSSLSGDALQPLPDISSITNQDFYNTVFQLPMGIAVFTGPNFIVSVANDKYLSLIGRTREAFIGNPLFKTVPELKGQEMEKLLNLVLKSGEPYHGNEFKASLNRNGIKEDFWFDFVYQPLKNNSGKTEGVIVVAYDVTASVKSKHILAESEKQFSNLVMQSPIAMTIFSGKDFVIDIANETLLKNIWRRELKDVQGKKLLDVFPELQNQPFPGKLKKVFDTGEIHRESEAIAYVSGGKGEMNTYYLDYEYAPLFEPDGKTVSGIFITVIDVTEKVTARKKTEKKEAYFRRMADNMAVMLFMSDKDGYFTNHNNQWYSYTGMTREESTDFGWLAAVHPDQRAATEKMIKDAIAKASDYEIEFKLKGKDGLYRWFVKTGKPAFDPDGGSEGYLGTLMDIHERKLGADILKESRQSLSLAIESAEMGTWDYEPATNVLQWDERTKKIFGLPPGEFVTYDLFLKGTHPDDRDAVNQAVSKATSPEGTGDYSIEYRIYRYVDNKQRWIRAKGKAFFNEKNILERFLGTVYDITEQKEAYLKMEDAESRLRLATEGTGIATWDLDLKTDEIIYSPRLNEIFGQKPGDLFTHQQMLDRIHPEDQDQVKKAFDLALSSGSYYYEAHVTWPDHTHHWIRTNGKVIYDKAHRPDRILGIMQDISQEKQILLSLQQSELRYRNLIYRLPVAFYTCDVDGYIGIYNDAAAELWGRNPGNNERWSGAVKMFRPDGSPLPADQCPMAITVKTGKIIREQEIIVEKPNGERINILPHPQPVFDENGNITGGLNMLVDITERKTAEKNTAWLAAIIESSEDAIVSKTLQGIVTSWNSGAEKLFGYTSDEMIGQPISKLFSEDRLEEEPKILERIKKGEVISHFDTLRIHKTGHALHISLTISPIKDKHGNLIGASKIARDITVQKNLYQALTENEQRLQIAVKAAELGTWELNYKTDETKYSRRYLEIMGFDVSESPTHTDLSSRIHPKDKYIRDRAFQKALTTGILDMELRIVHPDNSTHWIKVRGKVFYDDNNQPDRLIGIILDITAQKKAFEALQESELLFKTIASVAPVGLWMTDKEARNNFVNNTWIEWTGVPIEEQAGSGWMSRVIPEDAARVRSNFQKALTSFDSFSDEFRLQRQDGEMRWCLTEGFPFYNDKGEFEGYAGSVTDITERKMIEKELAKKVTERTQALNLANTALEKSNGELEQFAYVASHDLQEPLRKIKTFVGRLQESSETTIDGHSRVYMDKIISSTNRMSDLIRDLLEYSRTAKIAEKHSLTDLNEVLENVKGDLELLINQKKAIIQAEKLPVLYAVSHQMNQLFANLISNSLKFMDDSRIPEIIITSSIISSETVKSYSLDPEKKYTEIIFSDNGIGFSNDYAEKIFEIFQRLNPRSAYSGSGIGLSICRKIVNNHHGIIFADSKEGYGASFHIILPYEDFPVDMP